MDTYIKQLKSRKKFGQVVIVLSVIALLFNRMLTSPFDWILVGIAIIGLLIGVIIISDSNTDKYRYLKQVGLQIQAKVLYISLQATQTLQGSVRGGGISSLYRPLYVANFQIVCEGIDPISQLKKIFITNNLTSRPNLKITPNTAFRVYVDKNDSDIYWVDLSETTFDNNLPDVSFSLTQISTDYRSYDGVSYQKVIK